MGGRVGEWAGAAFGASRTKSVPIAGARPSFEQIPQPAMLREEPGAKTLREMNLPDDQWRDISHRNALRWLGRDSGTAHATSDRVEAAV